MDNITISAKTYDEAITKAMIQLQTTREHLVVEVVEKGTSGFLGIGGRHWTIRAHVKSEEEEQAELLAQQEKEKQEKEAAAEEAKQKKAAEKEKKTEDAEKRESTSTEESRKTARAEETELLSPAAGEKTAEKNPADNQEVADRDTGKNGRKNGNRRQRASRSRRDGREARKPEDRRQGSAVQEHREEKTVGREVPKEEADEIAEKAVSFLNSIFRIMEEEISIDTDFNYQDNELSITLNGDDMGVLIGKRGQTLDSLQYLVSLVVNKQRDVYIRVKLDTENYRERREAKLKSLARNIAHKVKQTRRPVSLEPMNPYERRIIHSALQRDPYVTTYSEGEDPYRHIVVILKKDYKKLIQDQDGAEKKTE